MTTKIKAMEPLTVGDAIDDEQAFIDSLEAYDGPLKDHLTPESKREFEAAALATMNETRAKMSLRVPKSDLTRLKSLTLQDGIPYQTLINSLIHRYVADKAR